jgi:hypothetical protein
LPRQEDAALAARDLMAIIRGLVDAAGEREETDTPGLIRRVTAAVLGYLTMMSPQTHAGSTDEPRDEAAPQAPVKREQPVRKTAARRPKRPPDGSERPVSRARRREY